MDSAAGKDIEWARGLIATSEDCLRRQIDIVVALERDGHVPAAAVGLLNQCEMLLNWQKGYLAAAEKRGGRTLKDFRDEITRDLGARRASNQMPIQLKSLSHDHAQGHSAPCEFQGLDGMPQI